MWSPLNSAAIPLLDSTVRVLSYSQAFELLGTLHSLEELEVEGIDTRSPILDEAIETTNRRLDSSSSELTRIALEAEWHVVYRTDASASRSDGFMWREEVSNFRKLERSVNIPARTGLVWRPPRVDKVFASSDVVSATHCNTPVIFPSCLAPFYAIFPQSSGESLLN